MAKLLVLLALIAVGGGAWFVLNCKDRPIPLLDQDEWWGPKELKGRVDKTIKPFKVTFDEAMIQDLRQRLKGHRPFTPPLEGVGFEYGFNTKHIDSWVNYWAEKYDFAKRETFLNQYPQYTSYIQGLNIHFIRVKPQVPAGVQVLPLMLIHGWPGSVREFYEAIPLLTRQQPGYDFAFEVIIPSLPGYGFSDAASRPGLGMVQTAVIYKNLMTRLGHKKFYVQGGDWGSGVASELATFYPEDILGYHTNMAYAQTSCGLLQTFIGAIFPSFVVESNLADRMYPLTSKIAYMIEEFGYFHLQATKPDTIGVALSDSPSGLLAYILEKFSTWTRSDHKYKEDGAIEYRFTKDQLIDNLMLYWVPKKITSSMRYYAENMSAKNRAMDTDAIKTLVPTWAYQAKYELLYQPPSILKTKYVNLLNVTVSEDGGHFLAFELPQVLVEDVFKAVKAFKKFHSKSQRTEL